MRTILLFLITLSFSVNCYAFKFRDSTNALFLRVGFKSANEFNLMDNGWLSSTFQSGWGNKKSYGFYTGLRHSKIIDKNNFFVFLKTLEMHLDKSGLTYIKPTFDSSGRYDSQIENNSSISMLSATFSIGLKYNFRGFRPAFNLFVNSSILSKTEGVDSLGMLSGVFKDNHKRNLIAKVNPGFKLDFYIPATKKFGFVLTTSGEFAHDMFRSNGKYCFGGNYAGIAIDYKISK